LPVIWVLEINRFSQFKFRNIHNKKEKSENVAKIHVFFEKVLDNNAEGELIFLNQGKT